MKLNYWINFALMALALLGKSISATPTLSEEEATHLVQRHLENAYNYDDDYFQYKLSNFSLRFDRCQYVKMYDDEVAQDKDSSSPLAVKHFAVFRLCPTDDCATCSESVFGRYVAEVEQYLEYTVAEQQKIMEYTCENCDEECNDNDDDNGIACTGCGKTCNELQNLEANGYIDAANYIQCQKLQVQRNDNNNNENENENADNEEEGDEEDKEEDKDEEEEDKEGEEDKDEGERKLEDQGNDDDELVLYIGPRCSRDGSRVLIGLFSDEDCLEPYTDADPEDFLGGTLSYHYLAHTSSNDDSSSSSSSCLSCKESEEDEDAADDADADDVNEMCEGLYDISAKCERKYGLNGFVNENRAQGEYENQIANEFMVCNFIESLLLGSYTEEGEIDLSTEQITIVREMTGLQRWAVSLLSLCIVALVGTAYMLQQEIERSIPKLDLACQSTDAQLT